MVEIIGIQNSQNFPKLNYADLQKADINYDNDSIFSNSGDGENCVDDENIALLEQKLTEIEEKQGCFSNLWNDFKGKIGIGTSSEKCDEAIEKYKNGEITIEEAYDEINKFEQNQKSSLDLFSNITTSIAAIGAVAGAAAITLASGGTALPVLAAIGIGAGAGAVTKAGIKFTDRATNNVKGDAADGKQIVKDCLSGAVTGGLASATMGTAGGATSVGNAAVNCAKTGIKSGAVAGASNYSIECAFEKDVDFKFGDFAKSTVSGAAIGGVVGGVMGGANGALRSNGMLKSGCNIKSMVSTTETTTLKDVAANSACTSEYKILNDRIKTLV